MGEISEKKEQAKLGSLETLECYWNISCVIRDSVRLGGSSLVIRRIEGQCLCSKIRQPFRYFFLFIERNTAVLSYMIFTY